MSYKIDEKLKELDVAPTDKEFLHEDFIKEYELFKIAIDEGKPAEELDKLDEALCIQFEELHQIETENPAEPKPVDPPPPPASKTDPVPPPPPAPNPIPVLTPQEEQEKKILEFLNSKKQFSYAELEKCGVSKQIFGKPVFDFMGIRFTKKRFFLAYTRI